MGKHFNLKDKRVFVAGHRGMVGAAVVRRLAAENCEVLSVDKSELDLRDQPAVRAWMFDRRPEAVVLAAAKVGGISANYTYPAEFLYENLVIETNIIDSAFRNNVEKLLFLGSSCVYPKFAPQPLQETALLTGSLEPTNESYAIAKIAGLKLCSAYRAQYGVDYISAMPANLYGPGDNFKLSSSHVIPALLRKAHDAKRTGSRSMKVWGSGMPLREFLHVDDAADALVKLLKTYSNPLPINVGTGVEHTILEVAQMIANIVGYNGDIVTDPSQPDGTPRKLMDVSRLFASGWRPRYDLSSGLRQLNSWFTENVRLL